MRFSILRARFGCPMLQAMRRAFFIVLFPLGVLWALQNFVGEHTGTTAMLLYLPQHLWAIWPLGFFIAGLLRRRRAQTAAGALGTVLWAHFLLGFQIFNPFSRAPSKPQPNSFRVMSYNIERGEGGIQDLENAIRAQHPDIVCLQESQGVSDGRAFAPGAALASRFAGWSAAQSGDVMTISHFRLLSQREFPLRGSRRILETNWQTPRGQVRVLNVHVATSFARPRAAPWRGWHRVFRVWPEAKYAARTRLAQIAPLQHAIGAGDARVPLLVAGDFNSPPRGLFYGAISQGLVDAWSSGGRGDGSTFPALFPLLPIDHVLTRGLQTKVAFVARGRASDHRALIVDLGF